MSNGSDTTIICPNEPCTDSPTILMMGGIERHGITTNEFQAFDVKYNEWWDMELLGQRRANFSMEMIDDVLYVMGNII